MSEENHRIWGALC